MNQKIELDFIKNQDWLNDAGDAIQPVIIKAFKAGGETGQKIKNTLHGTWLGHPVHPAITDVPIGAWTLAAVLDGIEVAGNKNYKTGADAAITVGIIGALGAAVTGIVDWTGTTKKRRKVGLMHGVLNLTATGLYATSLILRKRKKSRGAAISLSMLGYGITSVAAYLGGQLVFSQQTGIDHTATAAEYPKNFVAVLPENELEENKMRCVSAGEIPVLLVRKNGNIFAIANTCSHLGGPLSEGELMDDCSVKCPWHDSVFSLENGNVIDGPATQPQPKFDVRVHNGMIEVKVSES